MRFILIILSLISLTYASSGKKLYEENCAICHGNHAEKRISFDKLHFKDSKKYPNRPVEPLAKMSKKHIILYLKIFRSGKVDQLNTKRSPVLSNIMIREAKLLSDIDINKIAKYIGSFK